jgi:D-glycero-alpha-D-manno-heptose-7-phosphate kinase
MPEVVMMGTSPGENHATFGVWPMRPYLDAPGFTVYFCSHAAKDKRAHMLIRSRAPLRLGLAGGGTDVSPYCDQYGGAILNATIDYYAYASLEPLNSGTVEFVSADLHQSANYSAAPVLEKDGRLDLFKAVYNHAVREFNSGKPLSVRISTQVDVPSGSGLGSSSTLVVAMLAAFAEWLKLPLDDYELAHTAFVIEREEAGLKGGKQDQYAAAFGGFNFMEFGRDGQVLVNPLRVKDWVVSELEASLLLYFTGESRTSADIIEEQCRNVREQNASAVEAMHAIKQEAFQMKECLLRGDFRRLHEVLRSSWEWKKRMASQISNERIERLYRTALEAGAHCARISGAGGGGFMMFLTDPVHKDTVEAALSAEDEGGVAYRCHFTEVGATAWKVP